ncbi:MAG: inorganic diphosphatase, partial [Bacteroidota bacterium]
IIAVLQGDEVYQEWTDIQEVPSSIVSRLKHYFLTYKEMPGESQKRCEITHTYGKEEALEVIQCSIGDYQAKFGELENRLSMAVLEAINFGQSWQAAMAGKDDPLY